MDIYCHQCGEPWDHNHILDAIPSIRHKAGNDEQLRTGILDEDAGWWKFWFLYRNQFYEANYKILLCPACEPDVGDPSCTHCYGHGRVWISRATAASDPRCRSWFYGFSPSIHGHPGKPFRNGRSYQHDWEGWVHQGASYCPQCFDSVEQYFAAMKKAGWTEPYKEEQ